MVLNQKIAFRVFLAVLIVIFALLVYALFFGSSDGDGGFVEKALESVGFESADGVENNPAVPLPDGAGGSSGSFGSTGSGGTGGAGASGGSTGGSGGSGNEQVLRFCTFDAYHTITSSVPCRCGISAVCYNAGSVCDATFNNGQGLCS